MLNKDTATGYLYAFITVFIWGTTYIATKKMLNLYEPIQLMVLRFSLAYALLWAIHPRRPQIRGAKDEALFLALGATGITLYFCLECYALKYTYASNVAFIVSAIPLVTALLSKFLTGGRRLSARELGYALLSLAGVFLILFNGYFTLKISPRGDLLACACAVVFSVYSLLTNRVGKAYGRLMTVRKTFFYGLLLMAPLLPRLGPSLRQVAEGLTGPTLLNLAYLACCASIIGFVLWNAAIARIGAVRTSSFIYFAPLITCVSSAVILHEKITPVMAAGGALILSGVYLAQRASLKRG